MPKSKILEGRIAQTHRASLFEPGEMKCSNKSMSAQIIGKPSRLRKEPDTLFKFLFFRTCFPLHAAATVGMP